MTDIPETTAAEVPAKGDKPREAAERLKFTKPALDDLGAVRKHRQHVIWDTVQRGLCVLVSRGPKGGTSTVTFRVVFYLQPGKPEYVKIGRYPDDTYTYPYKNEVTGKYDTVKCSDIEAVRDAAADIRGRAKRGIDPRKKVLSGSFADMFELYYEEHAKNNRNCAEVRRVFDVYVLPEWAGKNSKNIEKIKKTDVSQLLSKIAAGRIKSSKRGRMVGTKASARTTRAQLVTFFNWYISKHSDDDSGFHSPVPRLMKTDPLGKEKARSRALSNDEIRALWTASGEMGTYGALVRTALLTAQRFRKVGQMQRSDFKERVEKDGEMQDIGSIVWDASRDDDPDTKQVSPVPLSRLARGIIDAVPIIDGEGDDFVFTVTGTGPIRGWNKFKKRLNSRMLALLRSEAKAKGDDPDKVELKPWQHRDLRRTARTLMARIPGISSEVAEHALAHVLPGVQGIYNRHDYLLEKQAAFKLLAEHVESIINKPPEGSNVVDLAERKRKA